MRQMDRFFDIEKVSVEFRKPIRIYKGVCLLNYLFLFEFKPIRNKINNELFQKFCYNINFSF